MVPLHSSLGDRVSLCLQKKKKVYVYVCVCVCVRVHMLIHVFLLIFEPGSIQQLFMVGASQNQVLRVSLGEVRGSVLVEWQIHEQSTMWKCLHRNQKTGSHGRKGP